MSFVKSRKPLNKSSTNQSQIFAHTPTTRIKPSERDLYKKAFECKMLIKSFSKEEIRTILQKNIGLRNMSKLSAMIEFLEIMGGSGVCDEFIKNIVLLSFIYSSGRGRKELAFADLVFQALYEALSKR